MRTWKLALAVLLAGAGLPAGARAHEVVHQVAIGRAVAVRISHSDGEALAHARYEVFSPADRRIRHQEGWTDRNGWMSFVPDAPGKWRLKVVDASGHGLDTEIEVGATAGSGAAGALRINGADPAPAPGIGLVLRPLAGVAAIGAIFGALLLFHRSRRRP